MEKHIAILVSQDYGASNPYPDDALLRDTFVKMRNRADIICWDDETVNFRDYDIAIVRSCWDYDKRLPEFLYRLSHINQNTILMNPYETIRENTDKRYLLKLEERGVPIVPTMIVENVEKLRVPDNWDKVIVKPTVSASGRDTGLYVGSDYEGIYNAVVSIIKQGKTAMMQEYFSSVEDYGERSSVVISGKTTFTMKKTPKSGGFLVHNHHGGTYTPVEITAEEKRFLELLVSKLDKVPLYMRVDYLKHKSGQFCLLELEQIEPNLYLRVNEEGLELLVSETLKTIKNNVDKQ